MLRQRRYKPVEGESGLEFAIKKSIRGGLTLPERSPMSFSVKVGFGGNARLMRPMMGVEVVEQLVLCTLS